MRTLVDPTGGRRLRQRPQCRRPSRCRRRPRSRCRIKSSKRCEGARKERLAVVATSTATTPGSSGGSAGVGGSAHGRRPTLRGVSRGTALRGARRACDRRVGSVRKRALARPLPSSAGGARARTGRPRCRSARRARAHTPGSRRARRSPRQTFLASRVEPPFSGKKASGSVWAQSARSCHPSSVSSSSLLQVRTATGLPGHRFRSSDPKRSRHASSTLSTSSTLECCSPANDMRGITWVSLPCCQHFLCYS